MNNKDGILSKIPKRTYDTNVTNLIAVQWVKKLFNPQAKHDLVLCRESVVGKHRGKML